MIKYKVLIKYQLNHQLIAKFIIFKYLSLDSFDQYLNILDNLSFHAIYQFFLMLSFKARSM